MNLRNLMTILTATLLCVCGCSEHGTPSAPDASAVTGARFGETAIPVRLSANTGGFATATGSNDSAVTVASLADLLAAFNARQHHILVKGEIYGGPRLTTLTFASTAWNNTTIEGADGGSAVLKNIQLKFDGEMLPDGKYIENVVIRNITFHGVIRDLQALPAQVYGTSSNVGINYEGVSLRRVNNAWIDHCAFYDTSDGLMSVTLSSDNVTVSYSQFYFTSEWLKMRPDPVWSWTGTNQDLANERLAMIVGANRLDSYSYGGNRLHVTLHHNQFGPNLKGRPLLRGWVHAYNNYFDNGATPTGLTATGSDETQYTALQIGSGGIVYSEKNYFFRTNRSIQVGLDSSGDAHSFYENANLYDRTTGVSAKGDAFTVAPVSYTYRARIASSVLQAVQIFGPR
ncbi:pectate lyase [Paraburkholderia mimosarum]|uniref:pectate lyase family protein n=1 Tax=Paraburkholderia mimosarum TaxID=312026 RepID=UPI000484F00B|nr:pectate lyase [Paraburkholderia mimosarum]